MSKPQLFSMFKINDICISNVLQISAPGGGEKKWRKVSIVNTIDIDILSKQSLQSLCCRKANGKFNPPPP